MENPKLIGQLIEVEADEDSDGMAEKLKENSQSPIDNHIRYQEGKRFLAAGVKLNRYGRREYSLER